MGHEYCHNKHLFFFIKKCLGTTIRGIQRPCDSCVYRTQQDSVKLHQDDQEAQ